MRHSLMEGLEAARPFLILNIAVLAIRFPSVWQLVCLVTRRAETKRARLLHEDIGLMCSRLVKCNNQPLLSAKVQVHTWSSIWLPDWSSKQLKFVDGFYSKRSCEPSLRYIAKKSDYARHTIRLPPLDVKPNIEQISSQDYSVQCFLHPPPTTTWGVRVSENVDNPLAIGRANPTQKFWLGGLEGGNFTQN